MRSAVIVFPGSSCGADPSRAVREVMDVGVEFVRHDAAPLTRFDSILLPGGFSYDDYLHCGVVAQFSPVINEVIRFVTGGKIVLGTCNGFQILTGIGLPPGTLLGNDSFHLICRNIPLRVDTHTKLISEYPKSVSIHLPVAHDEGNYYCDKETLKKLKGKNQVVFTYQEKVNGSPVNIAGICNKQGNVPGMMPHPGRTMEELLSSTDERSSFASIIRNFGKELSQ